MKRAAAALGSIALLVAGAWLVLRHESALLDRPLGLSAPTVYRVPPGASLARVAADLHRRGWLVAPHAWVMLARWRGEAGSLRAGEYELRPGLDARGLLGMLVRGEVLLHSFTIVDGWRVADLLAAMRRDPDIVKTLAAEPADLMAAFGERGLSPEGQFLPETYKFALGTTDVELLREAHRALAQVLDAAWKSRSPGLPIATEEQLLIVASIVEKESALPEERRKIAGLYLHRLQIGMRLQADPTVIYGLGERYQGRLHTIDLRTDGPYNTYTRSGLPPTPIALPGAAAIRASANPEQTDALYFVASGNGDGSHVFSATLAAQNAAVRAYLRQLRRREDAK
ncbi:MAG: endolytic transglycosylase MltG [Gammaproteobacteria bacterium]|nr:endolytic transglycosylase MltG [Gammaproteobacteria bacterium]